MGIVVIVWIDTNVLIVPIVRDGGMRLRRMNLLVIFEAVKNEAVSSVFIRTMGKKDFA